MDLHNAAMRAVYFTKYFITQFKSAIKRRGHFQNHQLTAQPYFFRSIKFFY